MVRTQIQLEEGQAWRLRSLAQERGLSMAEIIRRFVDRCLKEEARGRADLYARAARLIGGFPDREGAADLAEGHDRYLDEALA